MKSQILGLVFLGVLMLVPAKAQVVRTEGGATVVNVYRVAGKRGDPVPSNLIHLGTQTNSKLGVCTALHLNQVVVGKVWYTGGLLGACNVPNSWQEYAYDNYDMLIYSP